MRTGCNIHAICGNQWREAPHSGGEKRLAGIGAEREKLLRPSFTRSWPETRTRSPCHDDCVDVRHVVLGLDELRASHVPMRSSRSREEGDSPRTMPSGRVPARRAKEA